jgi:hypothetical protein
MTTTTTAQNNPPSTATPETAQATFISIVADASGSMNHLHETVIKGLNDFIAEQASSDNDAKVTIVQFPSLKDEDGIQTILPKSNVKTARKITGKDYVINGMTPLYDAIAANSPKMPSSPSSPNARRKAGFSSSLAQIRMRSRRAAKLALPPATP